jgi:hypothetical protein
MTPEEIRQANDEQISLFSNQYDPTWRWSKILSLRMLIERKEELAKYLGNHRGSRFPIDERYVDVTVINGLVYSALVELSMQIEDLLALLKFIRERESFVKSVMWYRADEVTNKFFQKIQAMNDLELLYLFMCPSREHYSQAITSAGRASDQVKTEISEYDIGVTILIKDLKTALNVYSNLKPFYNQYKHGLKISLGSISSDELRTRLRQENLSGDILCFHNTPIDDAIASGKIRPGMLAAPNGPTVWQHYEEISKAKNLYHYHQLLDLKIDTLANVSEKVVQLTSCLIYNRNDHIYPESPHSRTVRLPCPQQEGVFYVLDVPPLNGHLLELSDFT